MNRQKNKIVRMTVYVIAFGLALHLAWPSQLIATSYTGRVPDTGQTKCYDNEKEIPCPSPGEDFYGQDANYTINPQSFTKLDALGNDLPDSATEWTMVRDNVTGLIWEVKTDDGSIHDKDNKYTWYDSNPETNDGNAGTNGEGSDTEDFIKVLNNSKYGGFPDWRLPTIDELQHIVSYEEIYPSTNNSFFPEIMNVFFWSSTSLANNSGKTWGVTFNHGYVEDNAKSSSYYVRAVHGGRSRSLDNLLTNNDGTISDSFTGLMWQKEAPTLKMTWQNAIKYCKNLSLSDYNDWRLPTVHELISIVNYSEYLPAINQNLYSGNLFANYMSSTTHANFLGTVWGVDFNNGNCNYLGKSTSYYVRAVRGGQRLLPGNLLILTPEQSSKWSSGVTMPIKWDTQNISGNVTISISREGGKTSTYTQIVSDTPNDGEFEWTVTQPSSVNCMLKIEPVNDPDKGTSQGLFSILPIYPPELTFEQTELTLNHITQAMFSVSDPDSNFLTLVAFSSDKMLSPDAFINLGNSSNINNINLTSGLPVSISLTCYQADKNYGQAVITVEAYDENGLSASQQLSISVSPFHSLACENCEFTETMGMVATGENHYLTLKPDGRVVAWGNNGNGQLGTGDTRDRRTPALVQGLSNIISIQAGSGHSLALRTDGTVWSWGYNYWGQLGIGNTTNQSSSAQISTLSNIVSIAVGSDHSLALQADGTVWVWGRCYYENDSKKTQPIQVTSLSNVIAIAAGGYHSLALKSDGTVWSWGRNYCGQLGNGNTTNQYSPVQTTTIKNIISISAGSEHSMALHDDGALYAWGTNCYGQLGNGDTSIQFSPVKVLNISNAIDIECSNENSFAQLSDGNFMAWGGQYNEYPQPIKNMSNIVDFAAYGYHSNVVLTTDGNIKTWKDIYSYHQIPFFKEAMPNSTTIQDITSDCDKTCVALKDGTVWCWGNNIDGMHGLSSSTPLQITGLFNISAFETSCYSGTETALRNDGTVWNWGENKMGQLGNGMTENSAIPVQVQNLENVISVSSDSWHSLAIKNDGTVWAWGINDFGQLGDATTIDRNLPVRVLNLDNIVEISTAISHCLALKNDGTVWAWGANWSGLLGDGTTIERHKPVQLSSLSDIVAVRSNISLNLALKSDGTVWTWGNSQNNLLIPRRIPDLKNIVEIDISGESCIARESNGDIWVWGRVWNDYSFEYSYYPIFLKNIPGVSKIKAGYACFYFFMEDDTVWMWGHEKTNIPSDIFYNICSSIQIREIADQVTAEDTTLGMSVSLSNSTNAPYTITIFAENPLLIHESEVFQYQNGFDLALSPKNNQYGQTNIVVVAEDSNGYATSTEFVFRVDPVCDYPEISNFPEQITISQGIPYTSPVFYVKDPDTALSNITISLSSSNTSLLADDEITFHCNYDNCYLTIPSINESGKTEIEITLSDNTGLTSITQFSLAVAETDTQSNVCQFTGRIPDTGQTKCYDNEKEIPCPNPGEDFYGQDANYNINPQSFTKLDDQGNDLPDSATEWTMVRDNISGLIWEVKTDDGSIHDKDNTFTWYDSNPEANAGYTGTNGEGTDTEDFIKALNDSNYGSFSDWRLPTIMELTNIVNHEKRLPAINTSYFPKSISAFYWSSNSYTSYNYIDYAWGVYFHHGYCSINKKDSSYSVRAVRGGQLWSFDNSDNFLINNDETVTDSITGLMWQKEGSTIKMSWQNAIEYCENLSLSDYNDWRLPTLKELRSIVDYSNELPAINQDFFNKPMSAFYWSSTPLADYTPNALGIRFTDGSDSNNYKGSSSYYVRAVRGGQNRSFGHLFIWSPQQASKWKPEDKIPIIWDTQNISGNVTISISREGGKSDTFIPIATNTPNDGEFVWTVTEPSSVNCMLKIEPENEPDKGTTQGLFSILPFQSLAVYPVNYSISAKSHVLPITITNTNEKGHTMNWQVIPQNDWISIKENASGTGNGVCLIQLSLNIEHHYRTCTVLVQTDEFTHQVQVYQWANQIPSIKTMGDWYSYEDQAGNFSFQVFDPESDASNISIVVNHFCQDVISSLNYFQNTQESQQTFSILPIENSNGACPIAITVTEHQLTLSESFMISIYAVDDPPVISHIPDQKINGDILESKIDFTVHDIDSDLNKVNLIATPSNPIIVPEGHIIIDGQDENRHLRIFPITKEMGNVLITVIAVSNDLTDSTTFKLSFNTPPVAIGATWSLNEDTTFPFPLNSTDSQDDPLSYTIVKYPTNGTLVLNDDIVTYSPFLDFNGTDILSFKVNDGYSDSNISNVVLTIIEVPDPPVAKDLMFETSENTACPIEFAYTDVDGDILTPVIKIPPQDGHLSPDLIYVPNEWFWGTDRLIYSLSDGNFTSNTATVSILVNRADEYTLSIKCPKGVGEIEINGRRILLPWADVFVPDTEISIKAISSPDWIFNQWDHDQTIFTDNPLVITMDNGKIITAKFLPPTRLLKILGYQSVEINDERYDLPLEKIFYKGDVLNLQAIPQNLFKSWAGEIQSDQNPIEIDIQSNMTIGVLFEDTKEWALPIKIERVDQPQTYTDNITIGVSLFSETQPYQTPEEYGCSLYVFSSDWKQYSQLIHSYQSDQYQWVIGVNPHGNIGSPVAQTSRLYWNPSQFSNIGFYRMYKGFDQTMELVIPDMRTETSYEVTGNNSLMEFTIVWSSLFLSTVHLKTQSGWNLISLPVKPLDPSVNLLFPDTLIFEYENGAYVCPDIVEPGKGYWIKSNTDGYDLTGETIEAYPLTLTTGWHLVGGLDQPVGQTFDSDCYEVVFGYQNGAYVLVTDFLHGKGYWVKMKKVCEMKWGSIGSDQDN